MNRKNYNHKVSLKFDDISRETQTLQQYTTSPKTSDLCLEQSFRFVSHSPFRRVAGQKPETLLTIYWITGFLKRFFKIFFLFSLLDLQNIFFI